MGDTHLSFSRPTASMLSHLPTHSCLSALALPYPGSSRLHRTKGLPFQWWQSHVSFHVYSLVDGLGLGALGCLVGIPDYLQNILSHFLSSFLPFFLPSLSFLISFLFLLLLLLPLFLFPSSSLLYILRLGFAKLPRLVLNSFFITQAVPDLTLCFSCPASWGAGLTGLYLHAWLQLFFLTENPDSNFTSSSIKNPGCCTASHPYTHYNSAALLAALIHANVQCVHTCTGPFSRKECGTLRNCGLAWCLQFVPSLSDSMERIKWMSAFCNVRKKADMSEWCDWWWSLQFHASILLTLCTPSTLCFSFTTSRSLTL